MNHTRELSVSEVASRRLKPLHRKTNSLWPAVLATVATVIGGLALVPVSTAPAEASSVTPQSRTYSFESPSELTDQFDAFGSARTKVTRSANRGIGGSGSVFVADAGTVDTYAVYKAKDGYSLGPVGSKYTFETYFKSFGFAGWSGLGFTTQDQTMTETGNPEGVVRPNDAIGVSIAGSGFRFHWPNQVNEPLTNWSGTVPAGQIASTCANPVHRDRTTTFVGFATLASSAIECASVEGWYKIILEIERKPDRFFGLTVKLWDANSAGVLRSETPLALRSVEFQLAPDSAFFTSPQMFSYFNFSGKRFESFDGYGVTLSGGSTVVQSGFPVVLTKAAEASDSTIRVSGEVTRVSGTVQERGFVYSTTQVPEITDNKVPAGTASVGTFELASPPVSSGTYYVRAFATDSSANTSYGVEKTVTIAAASVPSAPVEVAPNPALGVAPSPQIVSPPRTPLPTEVTITNESDALRVNLGYTGDEGSKPAGYNVVVSPGGATCRVNSEKGFCDIPSVKKGTEYSISVSAVNSLGSSASSVIYNRVLLGSSGWLKYSSKVALNNFAGDSAKTTKRIRTQAQKFARNNPGVQYVVCEGFAAGNVATERQFDLALTRAKSVCAQLKKVNPKLETSVFSKVPGSAFAGANRKVRVTGYSPIP